MDKCSTSQHSVRAVKRRQVLDIVHDLVAGGVIKDAVVTPLEGVAMHVKQPKVIRLEHATNVGAAMRVGSIPCVLFQQIFRFAVISAGRGASPARILPLRDARQAVAKQA